MCFSASEMIDGTENSVVPEYNFFIDTATGVLQHQFLGVVIAMKIAGGEQVDTGHLELGGRDRALVMGDAHAAVGGAATHDAAASIAILGRLHEGQSGSAGKPC